MVFKTTYPSSVIRSAVLVVTHALSSLKPVIGCENDKSIFKLNMIISEYIELSDAGSYKAKQKNMFVSGRLMI